MPKQISKNDGSARTGAVSERKYAGWVRVVTAASLFDGHDAAINIMRRLLQAQGAEVIHLGHDRSVAEIVETVVQEDADAVAVSSYQGGHMEFFKYLVDRLRERHSGHVRVYGGGGGTILPNEIAELHKYGVAHIFSPEDGRHLGLEGMIASIMKDCRDVDRVRPLGEVETLSPQDPVAIARLISGIESAQESDPVGLNNLRARLNGMSGESPSPVVGLTGPGGAGKSSVLDEFIRRFRLDMPDLSIGILLVDPTRRNSQGALLGDRIRLNSIYGTGIYTRSLATRRANVALSATVHDAIRALRAARFDLIIVETAGIGQSDSEIVDVVDVPVYVMTPEYGAPSQLEKIDMLELADLVIVNKADRRGAKDAIRDVRKQWRRNRNQFDLRDEDLPVVATTASQWDDPGTDEAYARLCTLLVQAGGSRFQKLKPVQPARKNTVQSLIDPTRVGYLTEIAQVLRTYQKNTTLFAERAADASGIERALRAVESAVTPEVKHLLSERREAALAELSPQLRRELDEWPDVRAQYGAAEQSYTVRDKAIPVTNYIETLSHSKIPKVALPRTNDWGELTRYLRSENLPGKFPFTAGVFAFKREGEDPVRMFAGEGSPERTNRRFHLLAKGQHAARLSTAFDSVTLYGRDPGTRPDIYGKVGNSGVSVCTVDDAKKLYSGFDLCAPSTSVSMTINGPAPMILAFFLNAAIDQQVERHLLVTGNLDAALKAHSHKAASYSGDLPEGHNGLGLRLLGISGDEVVDRETYEKIKGSVLSSVRGTVQADILKEDQAQNTCIFSTVFGLKMMGDIQDYFIANRVRNFYSVSISGYHIAEAGANPITQLAFTLANGFTYVEHYLKRGMQIDDFAPNLSFFFSNGLDVEYNVLGRVARRIWAIAMRDRYQAAERSQMLKYHIQTSGRSLHAQEMAFNDIRTTLQALMALEDNANSLHTNAYDEAVTTPTEESVRRAVAIQLIINRELGLTKNENPLQGSYIIEYMTDLVEQAVLEEFDRLSERGGSLGAMETGYQRSKIQEESLYYESLKHSGALPVIGVNTFENPDSEKASTRPTTLARSTDDEKREQIRNLESFQIARNGKSQEALARLQDVVRAEGNVFAELMETVKFASLGQISEALFAVGGRYRRSM